VLNRPTEVESGQESTAQLTALYVYRWQDRIAAGAAGWGQEMTQGTIFVSYVGIVAKIFQAHPNYITIYTSIIHAHVYRWYICMFMRIPMQIVGWSLQNYVWILHTDFQIQFYKKVRVNWQHVKVSFRNLWQERSPRTHVQYTGHCLVKQVVSTFSEHMLFWKNSELDISLPPCGLNNALYSRWLNLALVVRTSLLNQIWVLPGVRYDLEQTAFFRDLPD
jgi:hypothetical protein